jgi:hypothetical protein
MRLEIVTLPVVRYDRASIGLHRRKEMVLGEYKDQYVCCRRSVFLRHIEWGGDLARSMRIIGRTRRYRERREARP